MKSERLNASTPETPCRYASILAYLVKQFFLYCFLVPNDKLREAVSSHVARLLKEEREKQKVSLQGLARKAGLARQTITFIETEVQSPTFDTMLRIASALNLDLARLIERAQRRALKHVKIRSSAQSAAAGKQ